MKSCTRLSLVITLVGVLTVVGMPSSHGSVIDGSATLEVSGLHPGGAVPLPPGTSLGQMFQLQFAFDDAGIAGVGSESTPLIDMQLFVPHTPTVGADISNPFLPSGPVWTLGTLPFQPIPFQANFIDGVFDSLSGRHQLFTPPPLGVSGDVVLIFGTPIPGLQSIQGQNCLFMAAFCQSAGYRFRSVDNTLSLTPRNPPPRQPRRSRQPGFCCSQDCWACSARGSKTDVRTAPNRVPRVDGTSVYTPISCPCLAQVCNTSQRVVMIVAGQYVSRVLQDS